MRTVEALRTPKDRAGTSRFAPGAARWPVDPNPDREGGSAQQRKWWPRSSRNDR